jgi:hypothetical protein
MDEPLSGHSTLLLSLDSSAVIRILRVVNSCYFNTLVLKIGLWVNISLVTGFFHCHWILFLP